MRLDDAVRWWKERERMPAEDADAFAADIEVARREAQLFHELSSEIAKPIAYAAHMRYRLCSADSPTAPSP